MSTYGVYAVLDLSHNILEGGTFSSIGDAIAWYNREPRAGWLYVKQNREWVKVEV